MKDFKGKVALITGSGNGIGAQLARDAAARGMKVAVVDIHGDDAKKVCDDLKKTGAEAICVQADVTIPEECVKAFDETVKAFGCVDLLVNNAGVTVSGDAWQLPVRDVKWIMETNVEAHIYMLRAVVPHMLEKKTESYIVNVASIAGLLSTASGALYHTTKYAAVGLAEYLYKRMKAMNANIGVSVFCPGFISTEMYNTNRHRPERFAMGDDPYYKQDWYLEELKINKSFLDAGMNVAEATKRVWNAVEKEEFYVLLDERYDDLLANKGTAIVDRKQPADLMRGQVAKQKTE